MVPHSRVIESASARMEESRHTFKKIRVEENRQKSSSWKIISLISALLLCHCPRESNNISLVSLQ